MTRNIIKLAAAEGRTFAIGQYVTVNDSRLGEPVVISHGRIEGFGRGVDRRLIWAKVRAGRHGSVPCLQDLQPDAFLGDAEIEIARRGFHGELTRADMRALNAYRHQGMTAIEAGARRAMDLIQAA